MPPALRSVMSVMVGFLALNIVRSLESNLLQLVFAGKAETSGYLIASIAVLLVAAMVGGFVAAIIAPYKPILHAGVVAAILFGFSVNAFFKLQNGPQPVWYLLTLTIATPAAVIVGAAMDFPELRRQK
ncbi:hypothetical protein FTW19_24145 [Terriglobus albidus]|uniref:Uncharacterized protein n=1 Tax=Terriglobus albidus TaxID=1592106 RepID=A0A5B9EFK0_9BACT|nr:hypothetical protein [Terriglobus albidus]QEE30818.1 hypothetical protein FTW19_24145 [Terriglobus albidus]